MSVHLDSWEDWYCRTKYDHRSCNRNWNNWKLSPKTNSGTRTHGICLSVALLYKLSYEELWSHDSDLCFHSLHHLHSKCQKYFVKTDFRVCTFNHSVSWFELPGKAMRETECFQHVILSSTEHLKKLWNSVEPCAGNVLITNC